MKRQIRRGVFETNSSSMHSLTVRKEGMNGVLPVDEGTNKVVVRFGEFGWGYDKYTDPWNKLSYLVTMVVETHGDCYSMNELYETEDFQKINDVVAAHCCCDGVLIESELKQAESWDGTKTYDWNEHEGYIDHQSVEGIDSLLKSYGCTIEEFIFDEGIALIIDNDNH